MEASERLWVWEKGEEPTHVADKPGRVGSKEWVGQGKKNALGKAR